MIKGMSSDNVHGFVLAVSSSVFIGSSFIIKKQGLKKAGASGPGAGQGGHSYLYEPWWWAGMITMILGEVANFAAYAYAPAILVTPLGALSIIFSSVLAHFILKERLHIFGMLGCALCVVGSTTIVLHAPRERNIESVKQVMGVRAVGIAMKLSFGGMNQFKYYETWIFIVIVIFCCLLQVNYLNKALDTFNTSVVCPVYYVMFTTFTIIASMIMFKDWDSQGGTEITTELCGFITIISGTFLLHKTKDMGKSPSNSLPVYTSSDPIPISSSR
ncbi:hypothetical protein like AT4G13800 [Hibiscus trionum]|uniref:Probable magnesium transporter n=1 Tax=Hibiscus trionum TaxID=183268 RepID=A0A9W7LHB5_HIBTR|nr:hypothetical protein like AT4G13800 [Hibiscus trionum]